MTLSFLGSLPAIPLLLIGQRKRARELTHYNGGVIARTLQRICFYPSVITGMENLPPPETACVYVANHQSTVDIAVFFAIRRNYAWVSKASVFLVPGVGLLMRLAGYVSLQRGSKESGKKMMEDCRKDCLEKGWSVVIFPQGTRRRHKILDFKMGAFKLAQEARVPIVPVTIELPEKMYGIGCKDRPRLIIHKPIAPDDPLFQDRDALLAHTFGTIVGALSYGPAMLQRQRADAAAAARLTAAAAEVAPDAKKEA
ncbi:hypothetical protein JKP88DRAFT_196132 [Tribonema minus]|uniref:Phospholipid/glycerol acyltransferase domain-containing protein n=1 Tax=Tribonema minus TaxID=303371 RepID=A0A835YS94_9STRA|nr:hypothetical protein JKP88DRAFT_196132 [Tribonema minus]